MDRYIDADKLLEYLEKAAESEDVKYSVIGAGVQAAISVIKTFPMEDVAPVEHSHWLEEEDCTVFSDRPWSMCAACGSYSPKLLYCAFCGAKMDEEVKE